MGKVLLNEKEIVVPGEELASGMDYLPADGTYRDGENIIASRLGLLNVDNRLIRVIPVSGIYVPKSGDTVIGKVTDITLNGWRVSLGGPYSALLTLRDATSEYIHKGSDLTKYYDIGDWLCTKIFNVAFPQLIDLTMKGPGLRKLGEGRIFNVSSNKVPRIIGRQGSMLGMIRDATGCTIMVGQNGVIWIKGETQSEKIAVEAIKKIERESHTSGLTEKIQEFLKKKTSKTDGD